jgi:hypothetical protein
MRPPLPGASCTEVSAYGAPFSVNTHRLTMLSLWTHVTIAARCVAPGAEKKWTMRPTVGLMASAMRVRLPGQRARVKAAGRQHGLHQCCFQQAERP